MTVDAWRGQGRSPAHYTTRFSVCGFLARNGRQDRFWFARASATQANTENAPSGRICVARTIGGRVGGRGRDAVFTCVGAKQATIVSSPIGPRSLQSRLCTSMGNGARKGEGNGNGKPGAMHGAISAVERKTTSPEK
jgi:hypothetical protein